MKVLTWYRPDADPAVCSAQQDFTQRVGEACARYDIPFVFELLVYPLASDGEQTSEYVEMKTKQAQLVIDSVRAFADPRFGVDLFKLESPVPAARRARARRRRLRRRAGAVPRARPCRRPSVGDAVGGRRHGRVPARAALRLCGGRVGISRRPGHLARRLSSASRTGEASATNCAAKRSHTCAGSMHSRTARLGHGTLTRATARAAPRVEPADASFRHAYAGFGG